MVSLQYIAIASALFLVLFTHQAKALSCYQCNSTSEPDCAINDNLPDRFKKECTGKLPNGKSYILCRKIVQVIEFKVHDRTYAIKCFECNSYNDTRCAYDQPPEELSIECSDHKHGVQYTFCRKITQVIEFSVNNLEPDTRIIRVCGWDDSSYKGKCYSRAGFGGRQEVCACYEDNCNSASSIQLALGAAITVFVMVFKSF